MKKIMTAAVLGLAITAAGAMAADGGALFKSKGCAACHQASVDTVGPSLKKIAQAYKGKEGDLVKFLKGEAKPIVDPAKFGIMKPQLNTTKAMSDDELKAMAEFMLSH
ncbi:cytochrome c [Persephonella hydrogeniphila]|uniref:Cytochrome c n=1 Tax=Persephonella hydrogeniphila TaxID=198703 RepID=A0A285MZD2_9AQUI|nr:c-type cytochrome [Persephonella hydrogeniphila]SNZ02448.1 cytochrome c [Persephonella hydrogeniphila]